jgi:HEAT repeats
MRRRIAPAILFTSVTLFAGFFAFAPHEPRYEGRSLSAWLADLDLESSKPQDKPMEAVRAIGTNAFTWLRRMLVSRDPIWEQAILGFNSKQSLIQLPITPDNVVRNRAVRGYNALGKIAKNDVPELSQLLQTEKSPQARCYIVLALGNIGWEARAAIPVLENTAATDQSAAVRENAVWALTAIKMYQQDRFSPNLR